MAANKHFEQLILDCSKNVQDWARSARELVLRIRPDAREEVESSWGGYLLFKQPVDGGNTVCFVSAHKKHVSIGFAQGALLKDPAGLLQGKGKLQRHVKVKKPSDLQGPELNQLITQAWNRQPEPEVLDDAVKRVRQLCLNYPNTSETISHGHPTFKVGKKSFAVYGIYSPSLAFKADAALHAELEGDELFSPTPYMARRGWLSMRLDEHSDWDRVSQMVEHSYRLVASAKETRR